MFTTHTGNCITYESNNIIDYEGDLTKLSWGLETILLSPCAPTLKYLNLQQQEKAEQGLMAARRAAVESERMGLDPVC